MATQRTTKKKAAKKTFPSTKKTTVPKLMKKWTVDALAANLAETQAAMAENHAKTEAAIDRLSVENNRTSAEIRELAVEVKEMKKELQETLQKTLRTVESTSKTVKELSKNLGNVGNNIGSIVEFIVIPHIRQSINAVGGHSFTNTIADTTIRDTINDVKTDVAQMDVFLYNDTEAMAVEIKTNLTIRDVNDHIDRLQKLRKYEENPNLCLVRKKLFGAVVGIVIDDRAKTLALENGLYVVKIHEDEEQLDIEKPETCRTW